MPCFNLIKSPPPFNVLNIPRTKEEWLAMNATEFEKRICAYMGWEHRGGAYNPDGITTNRVRVQIKIHQDNVRTPHIKKFASNITKLKQGIFVTWSFTKVAWAYQKTSQENEKKVDALL